MKRRRDPLELSPHWHVDCRIEAELPDDNIVGVRFLVHALFTAMVAAALLFTGWLGFVALNLQGQIRDWETRIRENRAELADIRRMQTEYVAQAGKIDEAYALIRPRFHVSDFLAGLGRSRPPQVSIDLIEWNEGGVVIRGTLGESSERAARLLGGYVDELRKNPKIGPLFQQIRLTDINRGGTGGAFRFEINCVLKPPAA